MIGYLLLALLLLARPVRAEDVAAAINARADEFAAVAHEIWQYAELGYLEEQSAALLKGKLQAAGFRIESGVADIPTAFIAEYGSGGPVIAILAEFDALVGGAALDGHGVAPLRGRVVGVRRGLLLPAIPLPGGGR